MTTPHTQVMDALAKHRHGASPFEVAAAIGSPIEVVFGVLVELESDGIAYVSNTRRERRMESSARRERLWSLVPRLAA